MNTIPRNDTSLKWRVLEKIIEFMFSERATQCGNILADIFKEYEKYVLQILQPSSTLSGSIGEGMPIYNDIDFIMIQKDMLITDVDDSLTKIISKRIKPGPRSSDEIQFKMDSKECYHGFTRLEVISKSAGQKFQNSFCDKHNGRYYLNGYKYFQECNNPIFQMFRQVSGQEAGPAITYAGFDYVLAIAGSKDLGFSEQFLNRIPLAKYNSNLSVEKLKKTQICVVAKAYENSTQPCLEFRLSFSLLENLLVKSFTRKQKSYYYLLKMIYRINLKNDTKHGKGFSSYYLKNLMFWAISEEDTSFWEQPMIEVLSCLLFQKLKSYIEKRCPNYFVVGNKMILNYSDDELRNMMKKIDWFQERFWEKIVFPPGHASNILRYFKKDLQSVARGEICFENMVRQNKIFVNIEQMTCRNHLGFFVSSLVNTLPKCKKLWRTIIEVLNIECDLDYLREVKFNCRVIQQRLLCLVLFDKVEEYKDQQKFPQAAVLNGFLYCIILLSIKLEGALYDEDIGGNILLGLFYYINAENNDFREAEEVFGRVVDSNMWEFELLFAAMPLPFRRGLCNTPRYFRNDKMMSRLFLEKELIYLEPVSFALYLLMKIANTKALKKKYRESFKEYKQRIEDIHRAPYEFVDIYNRMLETL